MICAEMNTHVFLLHNCRRHCVNSLSVKYVDEPLPDGTLEVKVLPEREQRPKETSSLLEQLLGKRNGA